MSNQIKRQARGRRSDSKTVRQGGEAKAGHRRATTAATARDLGSDSGARLAQGNVYAEVTARIIAELEGGRVPWVQPWASLAGGRTEALAPAMPRNAVTGRAYSGINVLILWGTAFDRGFASHGWLTFRQALDAGGAVRKGERGTTVVYADRFIPDAEKARAVDSGDIARAVPFLKRFTVFNIDQCEGLPADPSPDPVPLAEREVEPVAEALIAASGIAVRVGGARAYYSPTEDVVVVPPQPAFFDQINYYRTCLHELSHATGHPSRLGRQLLNPFGSKDYAREELVAEMGAAFLCASLVIVPTVRHADYIASWLDVLRDDDRAIFRAANAASKAADWLLTRHRAATSASADADTADAVSPPHALAMGG